MTETVIQRPKQDIPWWAFGLVLVCIAIVVLTIMHSENSRTDLAYLIGGSFVYAVLIYLPYALIVMRKQSKSIRALTFGCIFITLIASDYYVGSQHSNKAVEYVDELQDTVNQIAKESLDEDGVAQPITPLEVEDGDPQDDFGIAAQYSQKMLNRFIGVQNSYLKAITEVGIDDLLLADRLKADAGLLESRERIAKIRSVFADHKVLMEQEIETVKQEVQLLEFKTFSREEFLESFFESFNSGQVTRDRLWQYEEQAIDIMEDILDVLDNSGPWTVENGGIVFERDLDVEAFNAKMLELRQVSEDQVRLQRSRQSDVLQSLEDMKGEIPR